MTKMPPNTLPNRIIPMPNGIVMMPLPSGMTDSALRQYREDEEAVVEAGDVDRDRSRDTLAERDDELPSDRAVHHRAHLGEVEIGDLFAERVELANQPLHRVLVGQQRNEHVDERESPR